nr:hypothetical protein [Caproicibacter fermentans]
MLLFVSSELAGGVGAGGADVGFETVVSGALASAPEDGTKAELVPLSSELIGGTEIGCGVPRMISVLDELDTSGVSSALAVCWTTRETAPTQITANPAIKRTLLVP